MIMKSVMSFIYCLWENIMARKKQKKSTVIYSDPIMVRDNRDANELVTIIIDKSNSMSEMSDRYFEHNTLAKFSSKLYGAQKSKQQYKVVLDFGGMSPDKQYKIAAELGKRKEMKPLKKYIEVKDGPFSYSAECLRAEIFGK